jgi:hypothetical protein
MDAKPALHPSIQQPGLSFFPTPIAPGEGKDHMSEFYRSGVMAVIVLAAGVAVLIYG